MARIQGRILHILLGIDGEERTAIGGKQPQTTLLIGGKSALSIKACLTHTFCDSWVHGSRYILPPHMSDATNETTDYIAVADFSHLSPSGMSDNPPPAGPADIDSVKRYREMDIPICSTDSKVMPEDAGDPQPALRPRYFSTRNMQRLFPSLHHVDTFMLHDSQIIVWQVGTSDYSPYP
jgi:hypothetical protein